jgi:hypothetical protein
MTLLVEIPESSGRWITSLPLSIFHHGPPCSYVTWGINNIIGPLVTAVQTHRLISSHRHEWHDHTSRHECLRVNTPEGPGIAPRLLFLAVSFSFKTQLFWACEFLFPVTFIVINSFFCVLQTTGLLTGLPSCLVYNYHIRILFLNACQQKSVLWTWIKLNTRMAYTECAACNNTRETNVNKQRFKPGTFQIRSMSAEKDKFLYLEKLRNTTIHNVATTLHTDQVLMLFLCPPSE